MNSSLCNFLLISISLIPCGLVVAQEDNVAKMPVQVSVPAVSLVSFAESNNKIANIQGNGAKQIITPSTVDTTWVNYSSIVYGNTTNSICVNIISGDLPAEVVVRLKIGEDVAAGAGTMGKSTGEIKLSEYPQPIIADIGTCYTGQGPQKGHPITYSWEWLPPYDKDHSSIDNLEISVIYTLAASK